MQESIIVYRNPMEKALWESTMSGEFFPVIVGIVVFFAVLFATIGILNKVRGYRSSRMTNFTNENIGLVVAAVAGIATIAYMVI